MNAFDQIKIAGLIVLFIKLLSESILRAILFAAQAIFNYILSKVLRKKRKKNMKKYRVTLIMSSTLPLSKSGAEHLVSGAAGTTEPEDTILESIESVVEISDTGATESMAAGGNQEKKNTSDAVKSWRPKALHTRR